MDLSKSCIPTKISNKKYISILNLENLLGIGQ